MARIASILLAFLLLALLLLAILYESWGAFALALAATAGWVWYRLQVARNNAAEQFFGEPGEDTRLTAMQAGSPSEMPSPHRGAAPPGPASRDRR